MPAPTPPDLRLTLTDAPPTAGLRCPRCGGEPRLVVEDRSPTFPETRHHAEVTCCGMSAEAAAYWMTPAVRRAAERWALRYHPAEDRDDA